MTGFQSGTQSSTPTGSPSMNAKRRSGRGVVSAQEGEVFRTANLTMDRAIEWLGDREPG